MIRLRTALLLAAWPLFLSPVVAQAPPLDAAAVEDRISLLLAEMSVAEKAGQMTQLTLGAVSQEDNPDGHQLDPARLREAIVDRHVGAFLNPAAIAFPAARWHEILSAVQELATGATRHKIPALCGITSVHGANYVREATLFPHNLSLAATRNPDLVEQCHAVCARETRAAGLPWALAPVLDVGRQPLWPRFAETFGEDVHLTSMFGEAAVRGLQGEDLAAPDRVAACGRHFLGFSFPFSGQDRTQTLLPDRYLRAW